MFLKHLCSYHKSIINIKLEVSIIEKKEGVWHPQGSVVGVGALSVVHVS